MLHRILSGFRPRPALLAPALLLLLSAGFFWKLALSRDYVWFDHPDMTQLEIPRLQYQAREIHGGHFPLWDPRIWAGQPLIGQTQPGPLYPLNLLFFHLPLRNGYLRLELLNWYWVVIHFLAALFCYWLVRDLGKSRGPALLAGCAFGFGGFVGTVAWLDVVNGAIWTPLIVLFLLRALHGRKPAASAALSGLFLGVAWLSGHHEVPLMVSCAVGLTWLFHAFRSGRPDPGVLRLAALCLGVAGLISAVQLWPTLEFGRRAIRWVGLENAVGWKDAVPYAAATTYSMPAGAVLGTLLPNYGREADSSPFLGVVVVAAALLALAACWQDRRVRWLAALGAVALIYALGAATPLHGVIYSLVPMLNKARVPVRAIHLINFSLVVLAAFGVQTLLQRRENPWVRRIALGAAGLGGLLLGLAVAAPVLGRGPLENALVLSGLVSLAMAAVWQGWRSHHLSRGAVLAGLLTLLLVELYGPVTGVYADRNRKDQFQHARELTRYDDIASFLFSEPGPVRAMVPDQDVKLNFGDWYGIDMLFGYVAGATGNVAHHPLHTQKTQRLFSVTHLVASKPDRPDQPEVFRGASGIGVFRNPDAMPRAWAVHEAVQARDWGDMLRIIEEPGFAIERRTVLLTPPPALENCAAPDEVRLERHDTDYVVISASMACRGMVVLSETMFPGWQARIDGQSAPVHEAYGAFRGVVVEPGRHRIELRYRPVSVYGGLVLTLAGLAIVGITLIRSRKG